MPFAIALLFSSTILWLVVIRPYCIKHRHGYTPGANWGVTIWIDWQFAREIASERGDHGILIACRCFLAAMILTFLIPLFLLF